MRQWQGNLIKSALHVQVFFPVHQLNLLHAFFLFSSYLYRHHGWSSSPVALPCKTTLHMRQFRWKADDLMGKGRRKRRPRLLANRKARIWKQLNLLSWMLAISLTKYYGSFAFKNPPHELELCVQVPHSFAYMQSLIQNCSIGRKLVIFPRYITNQ